MLQGQRRRFLTIRGAVPRFGGARPGKGTSPDLPHLPKLASYSIYCLLEFVRCLIGLRAVFSPSQRDSLVEGVA